MAQVTVRVGVGLIENELKMAVSFDPIAKFQSQETIAKVTLLSARNGSLREG